MPIIKYPGYITKTEAAKRANIQVRSINAHIRKKTIGCVKVDGHVFIKDTTDPTIPPAGINLHSLEWVGRFAKKHKVFSDCLYEQIILGNITGVTVGDRVFVIPGEPALLTYLASMGKK